MEAKGAEILDQEHGRGSCISFSKRMNLPDSSPRSGRIREAREMRDVRVIWNITAGRVPLPWR